MERNISHRDSVNPVSSASGMYDLPANPFVGLRPFNSNEGLLFFGRHEQTLELLKQLHLTRFLAVVGSSGCGKSSLIRAGLIPKLKAGVLVKERDSWHIATMKPGDVPLHNLCQSLLDATFGEARTEESNALVENVRADGAQAIIKLLTPLLEDSSSNFLLLIDQFEELFAFASYSDETSTVKDADVDSEKQQSAELDLQSRREEA